MKLHLDFETRSTAPFGRGKDTVSGYQYANDPTTEVLCLYYAVDAEAPVGWTPFRDSAFPSDLFYAVKDKEIVCAHNAGFEYVIWNYCLRKYVEGLPGLPFEQMDCTAARAAVMALPRSLEQACKAMKLDVEKDMAGNRLMLQMAKPRKARKGEDPNETHWFFDEDRLTRLMNYCKDDVLAERALDNAIRPLTKKQRELWIRDHYCNMRGVQVDIDFVRKAKTVMGVVERRYCDELAELTEYKVNAPTEVAGMKEWAGSRGIEVEALDKTSVANLVKTDLPEDVRRVLTIRQEAGKSSVAKLDRYMTLTHEDGRMRENFLFHGAATGRDAGKGAQLQNLPSRGGLKYTKAQQVIDLVTENDDPEWTADFIDLTYSSVPEAFSSCLRGCIVAPPGKKMFVADYSNIEGRVAAWLGGEKWKLQAFRDYDTLVLDENGQPIPEKGDFKRKGPDLYKVTAGQILGLSAYDVDGTQRNIMGKVPELALGFGGGVGAFQSMASNFGVRMADYWDTIQSALDQEFIDKAYVNWDRFGSSSGINDNEWLPSEAVKLAWRARHPGIAACWYDAEEAAVKALKNPGTWYKFADGKCAFGSADISGVNFLISRLPSGRKVYKAHARLRPVKKFGKTREQIQYMGVDSVTRQWVRMSTYGGDLFQTFVQAGAGDIMFNGWENVEKDDFQVILRVHDEIGAEGEPDRSLDDFIAGMERLPSWAEGLPVSAAGYVADRYRKD